MTTMVAGEREKKKDHRNPAKPKEYNERERDNSS